MGIGQYKRFTSPRPTSGNEEKRWKKWCGREGRGEGEKAMGESLKVARV
jgi:hypothetical protein